MEQPVTVITDKGNSHFPMGDSFWQILFEVDMVSCHIKKLGKGEQEWSCLHSEMAENTPYQMFKEEPVGNYWHYLDKELEAVKEKESAFGFLVVLLAYF